MNKKMCRPTTIVMGVCILDNFSTRDLKCENQVRVYVEPESNIDGDRKRENEFSGWVSLCNSMGNCPYKQKCPVYGETSFIVENYK